jgi:hypothetical protein
MSARKHLDSRTKDYLTRGLILGLILLGIACYELPAAFVFKSSLIPLKGTLASSKIYIEPKRTDEGKVVRSSELIFFLNEYEQQYYLFENIYENRSNKKFDKIQTGLMLSDTITVWIKRSEINEYRPKLYQIERDKYKILLDMEDVRTENGFLILFMLVLGTGIIARYVYLRFPDFASLISSKI